MKNKKPKPPKRSPEKQRLLDNILSKTRRAAIYARYSSEKQFEDSIQSQIESCLKHAKARRLYVEEGDIYKDEAKTGQLTPNAGLMSLQDAVEEGRYKYLLVFKRDRLGRDTFERKKLQLFLKSNNIRIHSVVLPREGLDEETEDLLDDVEAITDKQYTKSLAKHSQRGVKFATEQKFLCTKPPFGYKKKYLLDPSGAIDPRTKETRKRLTFEIVPDEAEIVRKIFELYLKNQGIKSIANHLNEQGIESPNGSHWAHTCIGAMLKRETYLGWIVRDKTHKKKRTDRDGKTKIDYIQNPPEKWIIEKDAFPPIISEDVFFKAQKMMETQASRYKNKTSVKAGKSNNLLTGFLKCSECGKNFIISLARERKGGNYKYRHYICSTRHSGGKSACANDTRVPKESAETIVLGMLENIYNKPETIEKYNKLANAILEQANKELEKSKKKLEPKLKKLERKTRNLTESLSEAGKYARKHLLKTIDDAEKEAETIREELAKPEMLREYLFDFEGREYKAEDLNIPQEKVKDFKSRQKFLRTLADTIKANSPEVRIRELKEEFERIGLRVEVTPDRRMIITGDQRAVIFTNAVAYMDSKCREFIKLPFGIKPEDLDYEAKGLTFEDMSKIVGEHGEQRNTSKGNVPNGI